MVGAWNNEKSSTPEELRHWMLNHAEGYEDITYQPRGRSWFVLSGHRGDQIYYVKTIFSCSGRVVNIFAIAYLKPRANASTPLSSAWRTNSRADAVAARPFRQCLPNSPLTRTKPPSRGWGFWRHPHLKSFEKPDDPRIIERWMRLIKRLSQGHSN